MSGPVPLTGGRPMICLPITASQSVATCCVCTHTHDKPRGVVCELHPFVDTTILKFVCASCVAELAHAASLGPGGAL